jgi:nitrite reductase/ring-hydroxylating ferredoxin subunit/uncharacterized membrane protein
VRDPGSIVDRLESAPVLDRLAGRLRTVVSAALPPGPVKDALHGVGLGHPLHPVLTDLPIGFWTSAWVLDLVGGRRARPAADALVGLGVVAALPTAAAGLADWSELFEPEQRTGTAHSLATATATVLYGASYLARRRGRRGGGIALGMAGAAAATVGGFLGGHLVYRRAAGVNQVAYTGGAADWTEVTGYRTPGDGELTTGDLDGTTIVAARTDAGEAALVARCSHLGGPLQEGELADGCVRCPWHGSTFRMVDGSVVHGPATSPQPAYELRHVGERTEARRRRSTG